MQVRTSDNPSRSRFEVYADDELVGFADYRISGDRISITHTETEPRLRGRGLASALIRSVLDFARSHGLAVLPFCPFVSSFIERNAAAYLDLVPEDQRARFGLELTRG